MIRKIASLRSVCALLAAAVIAGCGCSAVPELGETTAPDTYDIGAAAAERGDYLLAIEAFKRVVLDSPLHELADDALMGLADSYRRISDFASAEQEYRTLLIDYPHSPLVPEAEYKLGLSFFEQSPKAELDQNMTDQALAQFEYFLDAYPESEFAGEARGRVLELRTKLAAKGFRAAELYFTLKNSRAARVYLEAVVADYPETVWARTALLTLARNFAAENLPVEAREVYGRLIELYPGTEEAAAAALEMSGFPD